MNSSIRDLMINLLKNQKSISLINQKINSQEMILSEPEEINQIVSLVEFLSSLLESFNSFYSENGISSEEIDKAFEHVQACVEITSTNTSKFVPSYLFQPVSEGKVYPEWKYLSNKDKDTIKRKMENWINELKGISESGNINSESQELFELVNAYELVA